MADDHAGIEADLTAAAAVLWAQARDEIAQQVSELDTLRTRAVALLSVAALVGGLFGSRLPRGHQSAPRVAALIIALALFSAGVLLAVIIALPRQAWQFGFDLTDLTYSSGCKSPPGHWQCSSAGTASAWACS